VDAGDQSAIGALRRLGPFGWARVAMWSAVFAAVISIPTRLIPNGWFRRMTPTRPQDYVFLAVASALGGLVVGLRRRTGGAQDRVAAAGGVGTFLAVGCPVCNQLVVALIGVGGATSVFAPIQPLIGVGSVVLLAWALRATLRDGSRCALPADERMAG
jgi:hypothetical protein